jgi:hypothetical protein
MLVVAHVNTVVVGALIVAVGTPVLCVMICAAVALHPLAPVTVTVYVPGVVTESVAFVPTTAVPFDHEYVPPPVAVSEIEVFAHVNTEVFGAVIAATGVVIF